MRLLTRKIEKPFCVRILIIIQGLIMLDRIKYTIICLFVVALCASWMMATGTNAQTCGFGYYEPSYGYSSYPATQTIAPIGSSPVATTPVSEESPTEATTPETGQLPTEATTPACTPSQASGYATVSGTVAYINGTVVPGAIVQLQSPSGAQYSSTSDANGHYEISNVKYNSYIFRYKKGSYESPTATLAVDTGSIKRDISLPALLEGSSAASPAAVDNSDIQNWYATRYTPQTPSNKSVIYDQSGHIVRVITGIPCQTN